MIVNGDKVEKIRLDHKGLNISFSCIFEDNDKYCPHPAMLHIDFEDLSEVEQLIRLLEIFRDEANERYLGTWIRTDQN